MPLLPVISPLLAGLLIASPAVAFAQGGMAHDMSMHDTSSHSPAKTVDDPNLPPDADHAMARLNASPRHGEWVMLHTSAGDSLHAWVVYPERRTKAPVVVVIHEIYGMSTWIRAVTDQLAREGYIAIAPDLIPSAKIPVGADTLTQQEAVAAVSKLNPVNAQAGITAAAQYAMALPSALKTYGVVGFCWGGTASFAHAVVSPTLGGSVVYYGTSPSATDLMSVKAPVLGLYGGSDARVDATVGPADSAMKAMHKVYDPHIFDGAGHGFLRAQPGNDGANMKATQQAWPATLAWFRKYLGK
ncbi:MAG: dienelactone hydrolase family protein [Gemmatimonadota bacterium]|nr:dienelactone hydrolase family protein [Gemmatimonadota bacterium]